jgi:hypothetical protein
MGILCSQKESHLHQTGNAEQPRDQHRIAGSTKRVKRPPNSDHLLNSHEIIAKP